VQITIWARNGFAPVCASSTEAEMVTTKAMHETQLTGRAE